MNTSEIETLHSRALHLYVEGRYSEAKHAWEAILSDAPDDARAVEGVEMVRVLAGEWNLGSASASGPNRPDAGGGLEPIREAIALIEDLLDRGRFGDAVSACRVLSAAYPHQPEGGSLAVRAVERFESESFVSGEIGRAMVALQLGDRELAQAACERILDLQPGHRQARALLDLAQGRVAPSRARGSRPSTGAPAAAEAAGPSMLRSKESATGSLFEMPLGAVSSIAMAPGETGFGALDAGAGHDVSGILDLTDADLMDAPEEAGAAAPAVSSAGPGGAAPSDPTSFSGLLDETTIPPAATSPRTAAAFSDLDAEIDQSQGAPAAEGDFDLSMLGDAAAPASESGGGASKASASAAAPAKDPDLDFSGGFEDLTDTGSADWQSLNEEVGASGAGPEVRITALLREAREFLDARRYTEAIESAARACAIDPDAPGAQQIMDEARAHQQIADRSAEESLLGARECLAQGRLDESEALFRKVLETHPGHREVVEGLDTISRRRREQQIRTAPPVEVISTPAAKAAPPPPPSQAARKKLPPEVEVAAPAAPPAVQLPDDDPVVAQPVPAVAAPAKRPSLGRFRIKLPRKMSLIAALAGGLLIAAFLGVKIIGRFMGPKPASDLAPPSKTSPAPRTKKPAPAPPAAAAKPAPVVSSAPRTLASARRLIGEGKLDEARDVLTDVVAAQPGDLQSLSLLTTVNTQITQRNETASMLSTIETAYAQGRYDDALRILYRLPPELQKGDIERQKANAWYNDAIQFLLGGNLREADRCLNEVLQINPADKGATDLRAWASSYEDRSKDLAFFNYVEALPKRPLHSR